jgi:hypothetical protein
VFYDARNPPVLLLKTKICCEAKQQVVSEQKVATLSGTRLRVSWSAMRFAA